MAGDNTRDVDNGVCARDVDGVCARALAEELICAGDRRLEVDRCGLLVVRLTFGLVLRLEFALSGRWGYIVAPDVVLLLLLLMLILLLLVWLLLSIKLGVFAVITGF